MRSADLMTRNNFKRWAVFTLALWPLIVAAWLWVAWKRADGGAVPSHVVLTLSTADGKEWWAAGAAVPGATASAQVSWDSWCDHTRVYSGSGGPTDSVGALIVSRSRHRVHWIGTPPPAPELKAALDRYAGPHGPGDMLYETDYTLDKALSREGSTGFTRFHATGVAIVCMLGLGLAAVGALLAVLLTGLIGRGAAHRAAGLIAKNRCVACGYDRGGLKVEAPCPECGQSAAKPA